MRWSILVLLLLLGTASAKPKIAVAPIDGDKDNEIGDLIVDVAADHGRAIAPDRVGKEMEKLDITSLSGKQGKKLRIKLEADALVSGKVSKNHLSLQIAGKSKSKLEIEFKTKKALKKALAARLGKQLDAALEDKGEKDEDEEDGEKGTPFGSNEDEDRKKKDRDDEDRKKKDRDDEDRKKKDRDDEDRKKKDREDEDRRTSKKERDKKDREDREDEDRRGKKKTARRDEDDGDDDETRADDEDRPRKKHKKQKRHPLTQASIWADVGPAFMRRTLTWTATGTMRPPAVGTGAAGAAVEGELYPASFSSLKGAAAGIGIAGAYERALGLGIRVPGTATVAPIAQGTYWIGARYRFVFGASSVAVGASYWRQYYMADRSKLMMASQLDMPDVDYKGLAPDVTARIAATPKVSIFGMLQLPLMFTSGPIQANTSYGPSTILAFDIHAGAQIALGAHYAVQVGVNFDQIGLKFTGKMGTMAATRSVTAATDRSIGLAATLGVFY